jgi:thioredoxin-related protein
MAAYLDGRKFMKKFALFLMTCVIAGNLSAAEVQWGTSLPKALSAAKKENKLVLMVFTGSDWCPACRVLDAEVFSKPEFSDYAKKNLVLDLVDFPADKPQKPALKKANEALQERYNIDGFPTLILMKPDGKIVWQQTGYEGKGTAGLIKELEKAKSQS